MSSSTNTRKNSGRGASRRHALSARAIFAGPGLLYITAFMTIPLILIFVYSFFTRGRFGGVVWEFTLENYSRLFESVYVNVFISSVVIAGTTTLLALILGYPTAYAITRLPPRWRTIALVLVVLPFWTNFLIRTYAWIILLNSEGPVNSTLVSLGIIGAPLGLLYTPGAVIVGLLYAYLPLVVLPIYASLERVMVGNLIRDQFLEARDWPFGAVIALFVVGLLVLLFALQAAIARKINGKAVSRA